MIALEKRKIPSALVSCPTGNSVTAVTDLCCITEFRSVIMEAVRHGARTHSHAQTHTRSATYEANDNDCQTQTSPYWSTSNIDTNNQMKC